MATINVPEQRDCPAEYQSMAGPVHRRRSHSSHCRQPQGDAIRLDRYQQAHRDHREQQFEIASNSPDPRHGFQRASKTCEKMVLNREQGNDVRIMGSHQIPDQTGQCTTLRQVHEIIELEKRVEKRVLPQADGYQADEECDSEVQGPTHPSPVRNLRVPWWSLVRNHERRSLTRTGLRGAWRSLPGGSPRRPSRRAAWPPALRRGPIRSGE